MICIAIFAEGDFEGLISCDTKEAANGYCNGYMDAAHAYGAGSAMAYTLPDDEAEMLEHEGSEGQRALEQFKLKNTP